MTFDQIISDITNRNFKPIYFLQGDEPYFIDIITEKLASGILDEMQKALQKVYRKYGIEKVMDSVSVCEGLILADMAGKVLMGQTLLENIDHKSVVKKVIQMLKIKIEAVDKGDITDLTIEFSEGFLIVVRKGKKILIGLLGSDGKGSVGLLNRQLKNIFK